MIAIVTTLRPATATKGTRFVATAPAWAPSKRTTVPYDHALSMKDNHSRAAEAFWMEHDASSADAEIVGRAEVSDTAFAHLFIRRRLPASR